ncbi:hypothetical protein E2I00_006172 [Balaenoptera physalus]|uniref:Proline dehydrogenase n=1 Tax=Balaenoptera physalus TaxID=9770 RepID=A0A6A1QL05_BALPH|nr:hypothetical protein E2I00_006172 [Balaenoptera physalus]
MSSSHKEYALPDSGPQTEALRRLSGYRPRRAGNTALAGPSQRVLTTQTLFMADLPLCAPGLCTQLLRLARRLLGQRLFNRLMKMTFYGQFVAGEDQESIRPLIQHNRAFGVGSILDYGVEEDLTPEEAERKEME